MNWANMSFDFDLTVKKGDRSESGVNIKQNANQIQSKKPKGASTAFCIFLKHRADEAKRLDPKSKIILGALAKECSPKWKLMTEEEKRPFFDLARLDRARYEEEVKGHVPSADKIKIKKKRAKKMEQDPLAPTKPTNGYIWFCRELRPIIKQQHPEYTISQVGRELGNQWRLLDADQRLKYRKLARQDELRYGKEMEHYKSGMTPVQKMETNEEQGQRSVELSSSHDEIDVHLHQLDPTQMFRALFYYDDEVED